jgi:hypothetical protein
MPMRATMLLADSAQTAEGKLYILGAGWNIMGLGSPSAIAVHIYVPWDLTNTEHKWRLELLDSDGQPVAVPGPVEEQPIILEGAFEIGRPPGVPRGTEQGVSVAVNLGPLPLVPGGRYEWRLWINGETDDDWRLPFSVVAPQASAPEPTGDEQ